MWAHRARIRARVPDRRRKTDPLHRGGGVPSDVDRSRLRQVVRMMVTGDPGRLSDDLDITNNGLAEDPRSVLDAAFIDPHFGVPFRVVESYRTAAGNWASGVEYAHGWDQGRFRVEIRHRESVFVPPAKWRTVSHLDVSTLSSLVPEIPSLQLEDAIPEKLRAIQQRATERDPSYGTTPRGATDAPPLLIF